MTSQELQDTVVPICNYEEEINYHVKKELDNLSRQLIEYNEKTFGSFMQEITKQLEERDNTNKKLRNYISDIALYLSNFKTVSQPFLMYKRSSFVLVKSITMNSLLCKFLSSISITLRQFFVYRRAILTSSSYVPEPLKSII
ncbi:hypothetical protein Glove_537g13 [Diversispora epigaea]|uniref:Uncharacterized protein n=1 Tax=Diversispora epigaea TaxID=1348612 RepID=A0A397GLN4_9GLOM|nr:hypothetical protein Glove_537g13 [Diversispora epigaea]